MMLSNSNLSITEQELHHVFWLKHKDIDQCGWRPRLRWHSGYYQPSDYYEAVVNKCVSTASHWLDIGAGSTPFPNNDELARLLSERASRFVGVDPSDNIDSNPFVHESAKCLIEDYKTGKPFDVITLRMVAEHIAEPKSLIHALHRLTRPGSKVIVFTVNLWSPATIASRLLPFAYHFPIKKLFWSAGEEKDTFPTEYKMNTLKRLRELFEPSGFKEQFAACLDHCTLLSRYKWSHHLELLIWKGLKKVGWLYPENCLLVVYVKS